MQPQLASIVDDFDAARARCHRLAAATPDDRWALRSDSRHWSVAECIAHLNLTSSSYVQLLRAAFAVHPAEGRAPRRYRRDLPGWLIGLAAGPLPRIGRRRIGRSRTQPAFEPTGPLERASVLHEFDRLQDEQVQLTREADGRPLERIRIASPFNARVSYNAFSCLSLLPRHQHRHLDQAEAVWSAGG
jgi:hypothetical protein